VSAPRLEIDLDKVGENARTLVQRLATRGIAVVGVTKAVLGLPPLARVLIEAGVAMLGDSRIENLERLTGAEVDAPTILIRSPMLSQVDRVVAHADVSCNTETAVLTALAAAATSAGTTHGVMLMVELGDLREGILPEDLEAVVAGVLQQPSLDLRGIGTNLACQSGIVPDAANMGELSDLVDAIEGRFGLHLDMVSGGNSANLGWALDGIDPGRVNQLRLGESLLLGRDPLDRRSIPGLHLDAFTLVAEVIEAIDKPSAPRGTVAQAAFGSPTPRPDRGVIHQAIVALGQQDTDPAGLQPPDGVTVLGASSDHVVLDTGSNRLHPGDEVMFGLDYSALVRAMTSPYVACRPMADDQIHSGDRTGR
jgi:ornithine racemase